MSNDNPQVFVGRLECGCAVSVAVDTDQRLMDNIEVLHGWLKEGLWVNRVELDIARKMPLGCICDAKAGTP